MKLAVKLPLFITIAICVICLLSGNIIIKNLRNTLLDVQETTLTNNVNAYSNSISSYLDQATSLLSSCAKGPVLKSKSRSKMGWTIIIKLLPPEEDTALPVQLMSVNVI